MANLRDIRRRIKSVKSTSQITKAMELVAAAKMKKAQDQALAGRGYADKLNKVLVNLKDNTNEDSHPLLAQREGGKELMFVISTQRGLCGGLNTNLLKKVRATASDGAVPPSPGVARLLQPGHRVPGAPYRGAPHRPALPQDGRDVRACYARSA